MVKKDSVDDSNIFINFTYHLVKFLKFVFSQKKIYLNLINGQLFFQEPFQINAIFLNLKV